MRVLMLSAQGDGLGLAQKMQEEGHKVKVWISDSQYRLAGQGLVERVSSWRPHMANADLILADTVGFDHLYSLLRSRNQVTLGFHPLSRLELQREAGLYLLEENGLAIPEEAEALEGIEIIAEGWFNGRDWITPFTHTFEEKRFLYKNMGQVTDCMGNVVLALKRPNKLVKETLLKLTAALRSEGYRGPLGISCIVTEDKAYALKPFISFSYDALEALMEGLMEPVSDVIFETAQGTKKNMDVSWDYLIAVRMTIPPWPMAKPDPKLAGVPVLGLHAENLKHIYLTDVYKQGSDYFWAAGDGVVLKATAHGRDVEEVRRRVYRTLDSVSMLDKQYRLDIGKRVNSDLAQLRSWGWLD